MFFKRIFLKKYKEKIKKIKNRYNLKFIEEKNKYISILNHDIKTPVLAQNQSLELLLNEIFGKLSNKQKEILKDVYYSNNFLLEVITNSIFLMKYEREKPNLHLENLDIIEQTKDCCEMIKNFAQEKQQNIIIKASHNKKIKLNADRKLIQKILFNILTGSISYGYENSNIEVSIKENKNSVSFYTKNKSIYMTKEKLNSLFENEKNLCDFNQLGMNLNLNIAKKLINAHNWDIIAKSKKDNSTVFGFVVKK